MQPPRWLTILTIVLGALILAVWLWFTPPGFYGKLQAVGYSVCHQAPARSFALGDGHMPLCARCTGTFLGAFLGTLWLLLFGKRRGGMPTLKAAILLGFLALFWALDGANSFLRILPGFPSLYPSSNILRLISGTGLGLGIAALLVPIFNQTVWRDVDETSILPSWRSLFCYLLVGIVAVLLVLLNNPILAILLAVLSILGVLTTLTLIYTLLLVLVLRNENRYHTYKDLGWHGMVGLSIALLQIGAVDALRYLLTQTWSPFFLPG